MRLGNLRQGQEIVYPRVVYQDVEAAEFANSGVDQLPGFGWLADVGLDRGCFAARRADTRHQFLGSLGTGRIVDDDGGAMGGEFLRDGGAEPPCGTGYNRHFSV